MSSGPTAVALIRQFGIALPITGILVTLVPATISLFIAWKVMKLEAPLALGAVAGQQCSTPAITAVQSAAGNTTPLMSYTVIYALSNVVLPLLGPIVVAMAHALRLPGLVSRKDAGRRYVVAFLDMRVVASRYHQAGLVEVHHRAA